MSAQLRSLLPAKRPAQASFYPESTRKSQIVFRNLRVCALAPAGNCHLEMSKVTHTAISHTITTVLLRRLERVAYKHRISRSAIVEYAVVLLFKTYPLDVALAEALHSQGARRRRP